MLPISVTQAWPIPYPLHSSRNESRDECSGYGMGHAWVTEDDVNKISLAFPYIVKIFPVFCFVWFDSLRQINNLSVIYRDGSSWVEPVLS